MFFDKFGNARGGGSVLTLEVKLGLALGMLILGGGGGRSALTLEVKLGLPLGMLIQGADPRSLWK